MGLGHVQTVFWFAAFLSCSRTASVIASSGSAHQSNSSSNSSCLYPAFFIFGDSLSDTGNNNHLLTLAKATRAPYGRDSPSGRPTGRFSDGLLGIDYLAEYIGLPSPPPYLSGGNSYLQGVTFASSGAGILNSSGDVFGQHVPLDQQVVYFTKVQAALVGELGEEGAQDLLARSLFYINIGSNDYLVNYLLTTRGVPSALQLQYSPSQFEELIQTNLELRIQELYAMGARKIAVVGLSALGCVPFTLLLQRSKTGACIDSVNQLIRDYNAALLQRIKALQAAHPDAHFTYLDTYNLLDSVVKDPSAYGFTTVNTACCGSGPFKALPTCSYRFLFTLCSDPSKYLFWDFVHPTEALDKLGAVSLWSGSYPNVDPYNLKQLALL